MTTKCLTLKSIPISVRVGNVTVRGEVLDLLPNEMVVEITSPASGRWRLPTSPTSPWGTLHTGTPPSTAGKPPVYPSMAGAEPPKSWGSSATAVRTTRLSHPPWRMLPSPSLRWPSERRLPRSTLEPDQVFRRRAFQADTRRFDPSTTHSPIHAQAPPSCARIPGALPASAGLHSPRPLGAQLVCRVRRFTRA
jgi:hypothetical protein